MKVLIRVNGISCFENFDPQETSAVYAADFDDAASLEEAASEWVFNFLKSFSIEFTAELNWKKGKNLLVANLPLESYPFLSVEIFSVRSLEDLTGKIFEEDGWAD